MSSRPNIWAIVLAAGDGTRLASLATDDRGNVVPKQFCSLNGGPSLLRKALQRALRIVPRSQVCAVVTRKHEPYWRPMLRSLPPANVIVEPRNCGTANGVLHGVLRIIERDPHSRIVFLPADHHVRNERPLAESVRIAAALNAHEGLVLIGIVPDEVDPELGYIIPGTSLGDGTRRVEEFIEKPPHTIAQDLIARGALWNSFIFAAHAASLISLMRARLPAIVDGMATAREADARRGQGTGTLEEFYQSLPTVDFSRSVLQDAELVLRVVTARACGWTDLGTPRRVAEVLQRQRVESTRRTFVGVRSVRAFVNLAANLARLSLASLPSKGA